SRPNTCRRSRRWPDATRSRRRSCAATWSSPASRWWRCVASASASARCCWKGPTAATRVRAWRRRSARAATTPGAAWGGCARACSRAARCGSAMRWRGWGHERARPLHPLARFRKRSRRHQGHRPGQGRRTPGLVPRAPRLHRPRRQDRRQPPRRRGRARGAPAGAGAGRRRARAAGAGRFQPRRLDLGPGVAARAGARAVPDGAADAHGRGAAAAGRGGADLDRARLARRTDRRDARGRMGARAPRDPVAGGRQPSPRGERGDLRACLRAPARTPAMRFFASCAKGLEYMLADELAALGCRRATAAVAGVNAEGELAVAQRAVLWSRLASRVLWPLAEYDCDGEQALYGGARALPWHEHRDSGMTLAVDARVSRAAITHARFAAQRLKDAVVDALRAHSGARPDVDVGAPDLRLNLVVRKGRAIVSVDLGGGPLHRRGWRIAQGDAPL